MVKVFENPLIKHQEENVAVKCAIPIHQMHNYKNFEDKILLFSR
jgi:hypothetical protein